METYIFKGLTASNSFIGPYTLYGGLKVVKLLGITYAVAVRRFSISKSAENLGQELLIGGKCISSRAPGTC